MIDKLSPETTRRIEQLVQEIAGPEGQNEDLRRELQGHIEDKLLGYMRGEETVTEEDAFVLAREHFGDRRNLRELLGARQTRVPRARDIPVLTFLWRYWLSPWPPALTLETMRRVLAFVIVLLLMQAAARFITYTSFLWWESRTAHQAQGFWFLCSLPLLFWLLSRWKRRLRSVKLLWFQCWRAHHFLLAFLGLLLLDWGLNSYAEALYTHTSSPAALHPILSYYLNMIYLFSDPFVYGPLCGALCLWWCGLQQSGWRSAFQMFMLLCLAYWLVKLPGYAGAISGGLTLSVAILYWLHFALQIFPGVGIYWLMQRDRNCSRPVLTTP